jgi:hypothetical protein
MIGNRLQQAVKGIRTLRKLFTPISIEEAMEQAENGLDQALEFFSSEGLHLERRPTIAYVGDKLGEILKRANRHTVASLNANYALIPEAPTPSFFDYERKMWGEGYGLTISDAAIMSLLLVGISSKFSERLKQERANLPTDDIYLYDAARKSTVDLAQIMVHEVWHIIETESGFYDPFTSEGTATYVANRFLGNESPWTQKQTIHAPRATEQYRIQEKEIATMRYINAAHFVEETLRDETQPLVALLTPDIRAAVRYAVESKVFPYIYRPANREFPIHTRWERDSFLVSATDAFDPFKKEPGPNTLVQCLRAYGATQLAEEIQHQDLTILTKYFNFLLVRNLADGLNLSNPSQPSN